MFNITHNKRDKNAYKKPPLYAITHLKAAEEKNEDSNAISPPSPLLTHL